MKGFINLARIVCSCKTGLSDKLIAVTEEELGRGLTVSSWFRPQERVHLMIIEDDDRMEMLVLPGGMQIQRIVFDVDYVDRSQHPDDEPILELINVHVSEIGYGSADSEDGVYEEVNYDSPIRIPHQFSPEHQYRKMMQEMTVWFIMEYEDDFQFNTWES
tara:strand:- start:180 stop:659 length:480 start_codon:yes stop_codon:yes gene_type:complete